ncbi:MAG: YerC/YecD family TrpR-related protein [Candidatus Berkelbacteria bacterium]|nr:YerC/YecD family TrpR-related protein [Candidatus Berkelbacteria bacterium]
MKKNWDNQKSRGLFKAVLKLQTLNEAKKFFRDLLTEEEIIEFSKRWQAAQMLNDRIPYSQIEKETGLSSTTVARVSKWLNRGMNGYKLILERMACHHRRTKSSSGRALR